MPTYEYRCQKCGHLFEVFQSMKDERLTDCPRKECDGQVKRLLGTGAGIIFRGAGFYETDYRSDSYQKAAKADSKAPDSSGDSGGGSSSEASSSAKKPSDSSTGSGNGGAASKTESGSKASPT